MLRFLVLATWSVAWSSCQQQTLFYQQPQAVQTAPQQHNYYNSAYSGQVHTTTTPAPSYYYPPAPVHYVNIGEKLEGDYKFGYDTGTGPAGQSYREEVRLTDGTVEGSYGYIDTRGRRRKVHYTAGKNGFQIVKDEIIKDNVHSSNQYDVTTPKSTVQPAPVQTPPPQQQQPVQRASIQQYSNVEYSSQTDAPFAKPKTAEDIKKELYPQRFVGEQSVNRQRVLQPESRQPFQVALQGPFDDADSEQPTEPPVQHRRPLRKRKRLRRPTTTTTETPLPDALPPPPPPRPRLFTVPPRLVDTTHGLPGDGYGQRLSAKNAVQVPDSEPSATLPVAPELPPARRQPQLRRQFHRPPPPQQQSIEEADGVQQPEPKLEVPPPTFRPVYRTRRPTAQSPVTIDVQDPVVTAAPPRRRRVKVIRVPHFLNQQLQPRYPVTLTTPPSVSPTSYVVTSAPEPEEPKPTFPSAEQSFLRTHGSPFSGVNAQQFSQLSSSLPGNTQQPQQLYTSPPRSTQQVFQSQVPFYQRPQFPQRPLRPFHPVSSGPIFAPPVQVLTQPEDVTEQPSQQPAEQPVQQNGLVQQGAPAGSDVVYPPSYNQSLDLSVLNIPIPGHNLTSGFEHVPAVPPPPPVNFTGSQPLFRQYNNFVSSFPTNQFPPQAANVYAPQTFQTFQPFPVNQFGGVAQPQPTQQQAAQTAASPPPAQQNRPQVIQQQPVNSYQPYSGVQLPTTLFSPYQQTSQQAFRDPFQADYSAPYQISSPYQTQYGAPVQGVPQYQALDYGTGGQAVLSPYGSSSTANPTVVNSHQAVQSQQNTASPVFDRRLLSYSIGVSPGSS